GADQDSGHAGGQDRRAERERRDETDHGAGQRHDQHPRQPDHLQIAFDPPGESARGEEGEGGGEDGALHAARLRSGARWIVLRRTSYRSFLYILIESGPKTARIAAEARSTRAMLPGEGSPCIRPRTASARCVTGLKATMAWSQPGIVAGSTKMLLAKVRGKMIRKFAVMTDSGVSAMRPARMKIQETANAKTRRSATARPMPSTPPSGRNPRANPSASVTSPAME